MALRLYGDGNIENVTSINTAISSTELGYLDGINGIGKILQVVRATETTARSTTSTSYVDVSGMSVTITPTLSTSNILIFASFTATTYYTTALLQRGFVQITDSLNNPVSGAETHYFGGYEIGRISGSAAVQAHPITLMAQASPVTTSPVTYKLRFCSDNSGVTVTLHNANATGQMYAIEVSA